MATRLKSMTEDELYNEIVNCDAFDQDQIAAELFLELWTRYESIKKASGIPGKGE